MMNNIILGITGGIAAYKGAELTRGLKAAGFDVRVVMTKAASAFITPLTLQALSQHPVQHDLLDPASEAAMDHISLSRWANAVVIAPASADFIAKLAHGFANDLLSTICLATTAPIMLAPAMNQVMWNNLATQANLNTIKARNIEILGPANGEQACGETGPGRMLEPKAILKHIKTNFEEKIFAGKKIVITAGPTHEPIDPVRYIGNYSSGKMGYALAQAAKEAGGDVTLISGPTKLPTPDGIEIINVITAKEMHEQAINLAKICDVFIAAAAVSDYQVKDTQKQKSI